jgi:uncharacterized protein (DUF1499 family)
MFYLILAISILSPVVLLAILSACGKKPANLGLTGGLLAPCPSSANCVSTQATDAVHRAEPIAFAAAPQEAMAQLVRVLEAQPRIRIVTQSADYIHAEARSLFFRFVDDVEFYVDPRAKLIHFRSASRVGRSDLGVNRRRMEGIRQQLAKAAEPPNPV